MMNPSTEPSATQAARRAQSFSQARTPVWAAAACAALLFVAAPCHAASEEIQVYMDDMRAPGQLGVDVHNNYVASGRRQAEYAGEQAPGKVYRLTPEFAYGLTRNLELGFYVLTTRSATGDLNADGVKARIKYIASHDAEAGAFWGANLEVGKTSRRVSDSPWNAELKGIFGYRAGPWTLAVNPNLDWSIGSRAGPVTGDIDIKFNRSLDAKTQVGIESYNELGPISNLQSLRKNAKTIYAVVDHDFAGWDLNAGIGRGLTTEADRWTVKFIVGRNFW